jgi:hypothetical protein
MTGLVQAAAGVSLAMGLALLCIRQLGTAFICLVAQSAAVAAVGVLTGQPLLLVGTVAIPVAIRMVRRAAMDLKPPEASGGLPERLPAAQSPAYSILAGAILALLCLSAEESGLPLAVVLLAAVLAAARTAPFARLIALGAMGNGIALTGCLIAGDDLLPLACLILPLPLVAGLMVSPRAIAGGRWMPLGSVARAGWIELGGVAALFLAALTIPLDALASVFAPLIAFDGMVRAWLARRPDASAPAERLASLLKLGCILLAVGTTDPVLAWVAILAAAAAAVLPGKKPGSLQCRQYDRLALACVGAGLALYGLLTLPAEVPGTGYFGLFAGSAILAAAVPDLAIPLLVLILRLADRSEWPAAAGSLGAGVAVIGLLACSAVLLRRRRDLPDILLLAQASIAALAIATLQPDGRFAAVVLLVLLSLTRTAARAASEPAGALAVAGLAGIPPLGVFPGLVLAVLAVSSHAPWLLVPLGIGLMPVLRAGLPRRLPVVSWRAAVLSVGWLPLALAALFGFFAPADLVRWLSALTTGPS